MRILHIQIYLFICCQAVETLDQLTDLGQNVTINCDLDEEEIYWLLLKTSDPPVMILRTLSSTALFFNKTFRNKYSLQSKNHLFINNITIDELGVYYCMKKDTVPPKFSSGTRLHINEPTESPNQETYIQPNHTVVNGIDQNENRVTLQTLTIILGLLNGVWLIVVIGLFKGFVVGNKRFGQGSQQLHNIDLHQHQVVEHHQDPNQLQYAEVDFTKLHKKYRPSKADSTYAALKLPKLQT